MVAFEELALGPVAEAGGMPGRVDEDRLGIRPREDVVVAGELDEDGV